MSGNCRGAALACAALFGMAWLSPCAKLSAQQPIEVRLPLPLAQRAAALLGEMLGSSVRAAFAAPEAAIGSTALVFADRLTLEALSMVREATSLDDIADGLDASRLGPKGAFVLPWSLQYLVHGALAAERASWTWDEFAFAALGPRRLAVCRAAADAGPWALALAEVQRTGRVHGPAAALVAALGGEVAGCQDWVEAMQLVRDGTAEIGLVPQPLADGGARPFLPAGGMPVGLGLFAEDAAAKAAGREVARSLCAPDRRLELARRLGLSQPAAHDLRQQSGATGQFLRRFVDHLNEQSVGNGVASAMDWAFLGLLAALLGFAVLRLVRAKAR
jgi:hypothetical protein